MTHARDDDEDVRNDGNNAKARDDECDDDDDDDYDDHGKETRVRVDTPSRTGAKASANILGGI